MITGKYDRQLDRSNRSKNVRDLALMVQQTFSWWREISCHSDEIIDILSRRFS